MQCSYWKYVFHTLASSYNKGWGEENKRYGTAEGEESAWDTHTYNINTNTLQNKNLSWSVKSVSRSMHSYLLKVTLDLSSESERSMKLHEKMI